MPKNNALPALILGSLLCLGLIMLGTTVGDKLIKMKAMERTVTVKGLAEKEVRANVAIWPIRFTAVSNDLNQLYQTVEIKTNKVVSFLKQQGFSDDEITVALPAIDDRQAQGYVDPNVKYRYAANVSISLYTNKVDLLLSTRTNMLSLAKDGIAISDQDYNSKAQFLFTELNNVKPEMVQSATQNARQVAEKFAKDSDSKLGKIKNASQGQFSISDRDSNTPYIKKIRIVSTLTYYLND
ncbi:SIMPL domain-containing protein [Shewanella fidelis]|uniref:SIMPL domain-containing protein n=1 Tax=Shewanella fidelis TaxID=173509 RepID=A0AAW8NM03_9GAMM|nr:SIMPL domain-containing protein [Shewanella fidelis]MDR8523335.1 SIMPL domain-containing protein [Shewanella fidelis]MDW4811339.1 SIMPL domain-containing protein [Shewanella fidelis]MDW4815460.1 SIMPL domain-containing protein [Shewanella fidelis]MDW4819550.1 SIMPL domain-containing protein [Shewanella fidelis]MDW4824476.1 SIMPL domain-containing protein [Shewanella fidelis]